MQKLRVPSPVAARNVGAPDKTAPVQPASGHPGDLPGDLPIDRRRLAHPPKSHPRPSPRWRRRIRPHTLPAASAPSTALFGGPATTTHSPREHLSEVSPGARRLLPRIRRDPACPAQAGPAGRAHVFGRASPSLARLTRVSSATPSAAAQPARASVYTQPVACKLVCLDRPCADSSQHHVVNSRREKDRRRVASCWPRESARLITQEPWFRKKT